LTRYYYQILVGKPEIKGPLGLFLCVQGDTIKMGYDSVEEFILIRYDPVEGSCEHGN
jgi:hypothetical protein